MIGASSGDVRRLSSVWRFSSVPVSVRENVAEHCYWVVLYGAMVHRSMSQDVDVLRAIMLRAALHDLGECVTGDVVRVFKYSTKELKAEVDRAEAILTERLHPAIKDLVELSGSQSVVGSPDGPCFRYVEAVVKAADFLSLFQYMRREAARGNLEIIPFYNRMVEDLASMAETVGVSDVDGHVVNARFPESFYEDLHAEATAVRSHCFHGLEEEPSWTRPV